MPVQDCPLYIGVDVAKLTLAIQFPDQLWSTTNNAEGHAAFLTKLKAFGAVHVVCEATGGYERSLVLALHQAEIALSVVNPRQVRDSRVPAAVSPRPTRSMPRFSATMGNDSSLRPRPARRRERRSLPNSSVRARNSPR